MNHRIAWVAPILWLIAMLTGANALWMLLAPYAWYQYVPAGVPDFGPFNEHFVRDFGCAYLAIALAIGLAARSPSMRRVLCAIGLCFFGLHALVHVYDTGNGRVPHDHWLLDLPTTYLPVVLLAVVLWAESRAA
jgi:hypothetical protein